MNVVVNDTLPRDVSIGTDVRAGKQQKFAVLANPIRRCGVHATARQQALILNCPLITHPELANDYDFVYLHWHPNFAWQHPRFTEELARIEIPIALVVHDFMFSAPVRNIVACFAFDVRSVPSRKETVEIAMPLHDPFPFTPTTQPNPDMVGYFGFYGSNKGVWTVLNYAHRHKRLAKFIATLHPFAPSWVASEFNEFIATAKRLGMVVISDWLEGQELADEMGECGFFVILHRAGGYGASASVCSVLAADRPVFADRSIDFLKTAREFVMQFDPQRWPTENELQQAMSLVEKAKSVLSPFRIWHEVHKQTLALIYS